MKGNLSRCMVVAVVLGAGITTHAGAVAAYGSTTVIAGAWAYTDSRAAGDTFVDRSTDAPVGHWRGPDGEYRMSRSYVSFDLAALRGKVIHEATLVARETEVANCTVAAPIEVWRTTPITSTTSWATPPTELEQIGTVQLGSPAACPGELRQNVAPVIESALRRGDREITLELRVPADQEGRKELARFFDHRPTLQVLQNTRPVISDLSLYYPSRPCGTATEPSVAPGALTRFAARVSDPDVLDQLHGSVAYWPLDRPDQRREVPASVYRGDLRTTYVELYGYPHGTTLVWTAQADDGHDSSGWAQPCYLIIDREPPATAPAVSSTDYPAGTTEPGYGGPGIAGTFRFDAGGDRDVVGYEYHALGFMWRVEAPEPGAPVTVRYTPIRAGLTTLSVYPVDAAGNRGPATDYRFWVRDTAPQVTVDMGGVNLTSRITMMSYVPEVTEFGYRLDDGDEVRVPAVEATATAEVVFDRVGWIRLTVRSFVGDTVSGTTETWVQVSDAPAVTSEDFGYPGRDGVLGQPGIFTFHPRTTGVVAYRYTVDFVGEERVEAAVDGTATVSWTPTRTGWNTLYVWSETADGTLSEAAVYGFEVIDPGN